MTISAKKFRAGLISCGMSSPELAELMKPDNEEITRWCREGVPEKYSMEVERILKDHKNAS